MKKVIILSEQRSFYKRPNSHDAILGQEEEFLAHDREHVDILYKSFILKGINRATEKMGLKPICDPFTYRKYEDAVVLYIAMSLNYLKSNLYLLKNMQEHGNQIALYIWDCWEPEFEDWKMVLDDLQADYLFFSFKQTYEHFKDIYRCHWVGQSANQLFFKDLHKEKTRMFMQMGRVNGPIHERILEYLKKKGLTDTDENYVYRRDKNSLLFPDLNRLVDEINRSKYMVCIPKIYENPKRTGNICAFTGRYYETIVCKTMIIGKKPQVFDELFPSDGMIEFNEDLSDFEKKIDEMEKDPDRYQEIVDKNYECFMNYHTWGHRLDEMMRVMNEE